jgi:hypothetical protein
MLSFPPAVHREAKNGQGMLEGAAMTGEDVHQVFEAILPQREIERLCAQCGVIERQRKLHSGMLVRAMIISAGTQAGPTKLTCCGRLWSVRAPRSHAPLSLGGSMSPSNTSWRPWPTDVEGDGFPLTMIAVVAIAAGLLLVVW